MPIVFSYSYASGQTGVDVLTENTNFIYCYNIRGKNFIIIIIMFYRLIHNKLINKQATPTIKPIEKKIITQPTLLQLRIKQSISSNMISII